MGIPNSVMLFQTRAPLISSFVSPMVHYPKIPVFSGGVAVHCFGGMVWREGRALCSKHKGGARFVLLP